MKWHDGFKEKIIMQHFGPSVRAENDESGSPQIT
jgi:hypothetical protein